VLPVIGEGVNLCGRAAGYILAEYTHVARPWCYNLHTASDAWIRRTDYGCSLRWGPVQTRVRWLQAVNKLKVVVRT